MNLNRMLLATVASVLLALFRLSPDVQSDQSKKDLQDLQSEILALDTQVNDAAVAGNLQVLGKVMSDDYVGVAPNGMILRKGVIAAHYQSGTLHYSSVVNSDVEIHVHGDCAILTAIAT